MSSSSLHPTPGKLYLLAALLWIIAGANVLHIGMEAWRMTGLSLTVLLWLLLSLAFFAGFIFPRVVRRNITFVQHLPPEKLRWWHCFTRSSWLIMTLMIALGITLRRLELVPPSFVAGFYSGLGASLIQATIPYLQLYRTEHR